MDYRGKKLLILAGAGVHCKVVEAAKEMGIYTIVTDYLTDSPAKRIADESLMYDIKDVDGLTEYGRVHNIDGVLGFCVDPTQRPAQVIAERLGLPMFGDAGQVHVFTNKAAFKQACRDNNVDTIPEYSKDDIAGNHIEYPVLVKPSDSRGSRGITICRNKEELLMAMAKAETESTDGNILIEKYMLGKQDLTISYLVKEKEATLISIGDRYSGREEDNLNRQLVCTIQPSRYADMYMQNVDARVKKMIYNLGIKNGPIFMQGFVDGNTVRMYDPGIRLPGNEYERIYTKAMGMNPVKSVISYAVGESMIDYDGRMVGSYNLNGMLAIQYIINAGPGTIREFSGLDEIAHNSNVIDIQQRAFVGDVIEQTGDVRHRVGEISMLVHRNMEEMEQAIRCVQSKLRIVSEHGDDMIISPISIDLLKRNYGGTVI